MIIDRALNSTCRIYAYFLNASGVLESPSTSFKIKIVKSNTIPQVVINNADMTELSTGKFYYAWDLSTITDGAYTAIFTADDGDNSGYTQDIYVKTGSDTGDYDKAINTKVVIFGTFADDSGVLVDADTSAKISIYPANSNTPVINAADMTNYETGQYYYVWDISGVSAGNYTVSREFVHSAVTYSNVSARLVVDSLHIPAVITDAGKPKIFDDNLIIGATATEPTGITETGLFDYIKDNRDETSITLYPDFDDTAVVKPDGDMDATTAWTAGPGVSSIAADTTQFIAGTASIKATTSAGTSYALAWTGSAQDLTNNLIGCYCLRFATAPTGVITAKLKIADSAAETYEVSATTDYLNTVIDDDGVWYYLMFNMQSFGSVDITDITDITLTVENTVSEAVNFYVDGLRFIPTLHTFEYIFSASKTINFVQLKGCNSLAYDVSYYSGSYTSIISGVFGAVDYITDYDVTGVAGTKVRLQLNAVNYLGGFNVTLSKFNVLSQLYEWVDVAPHFPVLKNDIFREMTWIGTNYVNKVRKWFECELRFKGFTIEQQDDLEFVETLHERNTPFYYWLNGNISDVSFQSQGKAWKFDNIYRVYDVTDTLKEEHYSGQSDTANMTASNVLKMVDASYVEGV